MWTHVCLLALLFGVVGSVPTTLLHKKLSNTTYGGRIFVTKGAFVFNSSTTAGLAGADKLCQQEGEQLPGGKGLVWKALIGDSGGCTYDGSVVPCRRATILPGFGDGQRDWVLFPNATYYRDDNTTLVGVTNSSNLFAFPFSAQITDRCSNPATGMFRTWVTDDSQNCHDWKNFTLADDNLMGLGWTCTLEGSFLQGGQASCNSFRPIYCVGPAASINTPSRCGLFGECNYDYCDLPTDDSYDCICRCGCAWNDDPNKTKRKQLPTIGAVIVPEDWDLSEEYDDPVERMASERMRNALRQTQTLVQNTTGTCQCNSPGGFPDCNDNYPMPENSSLVEFTDASTTPITAQDRITLFGDSITWLGGYGHLLGELLNNSGIPATIVNRGINGGMVIDVLNGASKFGQNYSDFETALKEDNPTYINIMIGINDVWFSSSPNASNITTFPKVLTQLVNIAQQKGIKVGLATVSVIGEKTDGSNQFDFQLRQYAAATRDVAAATNAGIGDVHTAYLEYEHMYNIYPAGGRESLVLTVDGVHPCHGYFNVCPSTTHANVVIANQVANALMQAAKLSK